METKENFRQMNKLGTRDGNKRELPTDGHAGTRDGNNRELPSDKHTGDTRWKQ